MSEIRPDWSCKYAESPEVPSQPGVPQSRLLRTKDRAQGSLYRGRPGASVRAGVRRVAGCVLASDGVEWESGASPQGERESRVWTLSSPPVRDPRGFFTQLLAGDVSNIRT